MTSPVAPAIRSAAPVSGGPGRPSRHATRALGAALALSLAIHLVATLAPGFLPDEPQEAPLAVTLKTLPPPPLPEAVVAPQVAKPTARAPARRAPAPPRPKLLAAPGPGVVIEAPAPPGPVAAAESSGGSAAVPEPLVEDVPAATDNVPAPPRSLPPRIDLAYKVFLGRQGFEIGDATYRFEHQDNRYRISTVGQARGLAALVMRGQGRIESRGLITRTGLQPLEFSAGVDRRPREVARFDWESGVVTLRDDQSAALETPTFDPLSLMWQYYFTPPDGDSLVIHVATTRRVARYTIRREGTDTISWNGGTLEAERWSRRSDDGKTEALAWLAPSLRYIPVKMRVTNTDRGTLEVVLDAIRVDETGATLGRDDVVLRASPPAANTEPGRGMAGSAFESHPGATFPSMTP